MKNKAFRRALAAGLAGVMALPAFFVTPIRAAESDNFGKELSDLLKNEDDSAYFDTMRLQLGSKVLKVDGEEQTMDAAPDLKNDRTMLPIRAVAEAAGAEVDYDAASKTVMITGAYGDEIECPVGAETMTVNSSAMALDSAAYIKEGRTYLPVRAVSEALSMEVEWDQSTSTVTLTAPYQSARVLVLADSLDTGKLGAEKVIHDGDGMWVLQFASPAEAKDAVETLTGMGITAEPDLYIPPVANGDEGDVSATDGHYTWGAVNCGFDQFLAQNAGQLKGRSGVVAVVDSGVDVNHPFLKGKTVGGKDFVDNDNTPNDENSHGTHVAGTIIDCTGSADVKIMPVRVLNAKGSGSVSLVSQGIKYAANNNADVINLSLGGRHSAIQDAAVQYAVDKGSAVVIAAGNDNQNTQNACPAHLTVPGTIIVSAGNAKREKADFSNYGSNVDLMAPGVSIKAAIPGGSYGSKNGTSMAAPHASAAAILLDLVWGKSLTPAQVEEKVHSATTNGRFTDAQAGYGFLEMTKADAPKTAEPSMTLTNPRASQLNETTMRLAVDCETSDLTLTGVQVYLGSSAGNLSRISNSNLKTSSQKFTNVYEHNISGMEAGTYYFQFVFLAGDKKFESALGSFVIAKKDEPAKEPEKKPETPAQPEQPKQDRTATGYAVGTDGSLAINDKPAVSPGWSNQIGAVPEGAACTVYTDRQNGSWYWVSYNGVEGYAHSKYLSFTKPQQPAQPAVNTRTGVVHNTDGTLAINDKPAVSPKWSRQIGAIPEGATCTVYPDKTSGSWYWVSYNGVEGYAHKNYIRLQ